MNIGVLGCGWLGLPLAARLVSLGHKVTGSTTTSDKLDQLQAQGIHPFILEVKENTIEGNIVQFLDHLELLIIDIPPGLRQDPTSSFTAKMRQLYEHLTSSSIKRIIFTSSIAVYAERYPFLQHGEDSTQYSSSKSAEQLLAAEKLIQELPQSTLVLRLGGLIGGDRHPIHHIAGKTLNNGLAPINMVHRNDVIAAITQSLVLPETIAMLNLVYPDHSAKKDYYKAKAEAMGLASPIVEHSTHPAGKIIHSRAEELIPNFSYQHEV